MRSTAGILPRVACGRGRKARGVVTTGQYARRLDRVKIDDMAAIEQTKRQRTVRRGLWLTWATLAYNAIEAILSIGSGVIVGSVALVGFGIESTVELASSAVGLWRLRADLDPVSRKLSERQALFVIGYCFLALAVYIAYEAATSLVRRNAPDPSIVGMLVALCSLIVMPLLANAKRHVALDLESPALVAEAKQTQICGYLSAVLLAGVGLNAILGWWWADSVAALVMVPLIAFEGMQALRGRSVCCDCV